MVAMSNDYLHSDGVWVHRDLLHTPSLGSYLHNLQCIVVFLLVFVLT